MHPAAMMETVLRTRGGDDDDAVAIMLIYLSFISFDCAGCLVNLR